MIEEPVASEENDVAYEVNLIGFTTAEDEVYLADGNVTVDGLEIESDETGLFYAEKVLVGKKGKVLQVRKEGFLPGASRIANHGSLEEVVLNLQLPKAPEAITISTAGGSIEDESGKLVVESDATATNADFMFRSFTAGEVNLGNSDQLYIDSEVEVLLKEASFYVNGSEELTTNAKLSVELKMDQFKMNDITKLSIFYYDDVNLMWVRKDVPIEQSRNRILLEIAEYGWWTIAQTVEAEYGSLEINQLNAQDLKKAGVNLSYGNDKYSGPTSYTSTSGSISTYFPTGMSLTASLDNGNYESTEPSGITKGVPNVTISFDALVQATFSAKAYACDFSESKGFVAVLNGGQHKIEQLDDGVFQSESFENGEGIRFHFYTEELQYENSSDSDLESILNENNNLFACEDLDDNLVVSDGSDLFEDFDQCRIKVRPKETVVIGERADGEVFLVSFEGQKQGVYNGLFYNEKVLEDVKSDVVVNIVLYDEEAQKVGGYINTEYISTGEELIISFIGNIE